MPRSIRGPATIAAALLVAHLPGAAAHAIAGARIFPVTLNLDDPGVADEVTFPQLTYQRSGADGGPGPVQDIDSAFEYDKRLTRDFGLAINDDVSFADTEHDKTRVGWGNVDVTAKYQVLVDAPREMIVSLGVSRAFGRTGTSHTGAAEYGSTSPIFYFGKGFGDISNDSVRPFALTGEFAYTIADKELKDVYEPPPPAIGVAMSGAQFNNGTANSWSGGFSVQYSIPYLVSQVRDFRAPPFLKHLIPLVEVAWSSPAASPSNAPTQFTIAPGFIWINRAYQIGLEALIPGNKATGTNVGAILQLHVFLDDLLPRSLGAPISDW